MLIYIPLSRDKSLSGHISLQLCHTSLDDDAIQYCALSYVWGDTKEKVDIEVGREQLQCRTLCIHNQLY